MRRHVMSAKRAVRFEKLVVGILLVLCLILPGCSALGGGGGNSSRPEISSHEIPSKPEREESTKTEASGESSDNSNPESGESSTGSESSESSTNSSESSSATESSSTSSSTESSSSSSATESGDSADGRSFYEQYGYYGESWIGWTYVKIVGVDTALDYYGLPLVRFFIETYSARNRIVTPTDDYYLGCYQDGNELQRTYPNDDYRMPDDEYMYNDMAGGTTQRYAVSYSYNPNGGPLNLRFFNYDGSGYEIFVGLDEIQESVPVFEPETVDYRLITYDLPPVRTSADGMYTFSIDSYELTTNWDGQWTIRVFFSFTNNGDEYNPAPYDVLSCLAFQDGIGIVGTYTDEDVATDQAAYMGSTPVGVTTKFSECFVLIGDSPVEVVLTPHNNIYIYDTVEMAAQFIELQ